MTSWPRMSNSTRWAAAAIAVVYSFGCSLMINVVVAVGDWPLCDERPLRAVEQCFDGSAGVHAMSLFACWTSAAAAAITALLALVHVARGHGGEREILAAGITAVAVGAVGVLAGSI